MIQINEEQLLTLVKEHIEEEIDYCETLDIRDEDDLHDFILGIYLGDVTIEEYDFYYYNCVALLPQIVDDVIDFINDCYDYANVIDEQWQVYYSMIAL